MCHFLNLKQFKIYAKVFVGKVHYKWLREKNHLGSVHVVKCHICYVLRRERRETQVLTNRGQWGMFLSYGIIFSSSFLKNFNLEDVYFSGHDFELHNCVGPNAGWLQQTQSI